MFDDQTQSQLIPKLLLHVFVIELNNSLFSDPSAGGIKDARDEDHFSRSHTTTLRSLLPPQVKQMSAQYKVVCGCECCISAKIIHSSLLSLRDRSFKN